VKRILAIVVAGLLGAGAGYFLARREPTPVEVKEKLATCETSLDAETRSTKGLAEELTETTDRERALQDQFDACKAAR
jgi:hypothetical protein